MLDARDSVIDEEAVDEARSVVIVALIGAAAIRIPEILDQNWYVDELVLGILEIQLKESVGLQWQCPRIVPRQIKKLELAIILSDDAKSGHHIDLFHIHGARGQIVVQLLHGHELAIHVVSSQPELELVCPGQIIARVIEVDCELRRRSILEDLLWSLRIVEPRNALFPAIILVERNLFALFSFCLLQILEQLAGDGALVVEIEDAEVG